jgi:hypothetical protein
MPDPFPKRVHELRVHHDAVACSDNFAATFRTLLWSWRDIPAPSSPWSNLLMPAGRTRTCIWTPCRERETRRIRTGFQLVVRLPKGAPDRAASDRLPPETFSRAVPLWDALTGPSADRAEWILELRMVRRDTAAARASQPACIRNLSPSSRENGIRSTSFVWYARYHGSNSITRSNGLRMQPLRRTCTLA